MIKECSVLLNNEAVTVVKYDDDITIQFPSINRKAKTVFVKYEDGEYSIVDKDYKESAAKPKKKSTKKKTTIERREIKVDIENTEINTDNQA